MLGLKLSFDVCFRVSDDVQYVFRSELAVLWVRVVFCVVFLAGIKVKQPTLVISAAVSSFSIYFFACAVVCMFLLRLGSARPDRFHDFTAGATKAAVFFCCCVCFGSSSWRVQPNDILYLEDLGILAQETRASALTSSFLSKTCSTFSYHSSTSKTRNQ